MKDIIWPIVTMVSVIIIIWGAMYFVSGAVQDIEVVEVEPGVKCAISSRFVNNSIDCWKTE